MDDRLQEKSGISLVALDHVYMIGPPLDAPTMRCVMAIVVAIGLSIIFVACRDVTKSVGRCHFDRDEGVTLFTKIHGHLATIEQRMLEYSSVIAISSDGTSAFITLDSIGDSRRYLELQIDWSDTTSVRKADSILHSEFDYNLDSLRRFADYLFEVNVAVATHHFYPHDPSIRAIFIRVQQKTRGGCRFSFNRLHEVGRYDPVPYGLIDIGGWGVSAD